MNTRTGDASRAATSRLPAELHRGELRQWCDVHDLVGEVVVEAIEVENQLERLVPRHVVKLERDPQRRAELLLENGTRMHVFAATMLGMSAVVRAVLDARPDTHGVPGPHGIPLLCHAIVGREHSLDLVEFLIERGAAVGAASNLGVTPLSMASSTVQIDTVKLLLDRGAAKDPRDAKGRRAIDRAMERDHAAVVSLLSE